MVAEWVREPLIAVTVTVPVPVTGVPPDEDEVVELELPPPPQPIMIAIAMISITARIAIFVFFDVRSRLPTSINPMAMAKEPSVQGKKWGNSFGARSLTVRVVGAVTVTVAVPALVSEAGKTEHVVPGSDATAQVRDTVPVNPFRAVTVRVVVPTFPVVPAVRVIVEVLRTGRKSGTTSDNAAVWVTPPALAVSVTVDDVPAGIELAAVMVTVAVPALVTEGGKIEHVTPGSDVGTLHASATLPVKPFNAEIVSVDVPTFPVVPEFTVKTAGALVTLP